MLSVSLREMKLFQNPQETRLLFYEDRALYSVKSDGSDLRREFPAKL